MMRRSGFLAVVAAIVMVACDSNPAEVLPLEVNRVEVGPTGRTILVGDTLRLNAYPKTADGTILGSVRVDWSAGASDVVSLSSNGLVKGLKPGSVAITATAAGKTGSTTVTVVASPVAIDRIEISPASASMQIGQAQQLEARLFAADGTQLDGRQVTWVTSNGGRATVVAQADTRTAMLTAHAVGEVTISAQAEGKSASLTVMVVAQPEPVVGSVIVTPSEITAWVGTTRTYTANVLGPNGGPLQNPPPVTWTVSASAIATAGLNGQVTALNRGSALVTATSGGKSGSAKLYVYPLPSDSMTFIVEPNVDGAGNPRIATPVGQKVWYDANGTAYNAVMLVSGGSLKLVHSGGTPRYALTWRIDLVATINGYGQTVGTEWLDETGTYELAYDMSTGLPIYRLALSSGSVTEDARWAAPGRLVTQIAVGAGARQDWYWTQVF